MSLPVGSQVLLNVGETYTYQFSSLPFVGTSTLVFGNPGGVHAFTTIDPNSFGPGDSIRLEIFETAPSDQPIVVGTLTDGPLFNGPFGQGIGGGTLAGWTDRQGAVRLTQLAGSAVIERITLEHYELVNPQLLNIYRETVVPVPEPSVGLLALVSIAAWARFRARRDDPT